MDYILVGGVILFIILISIQYTLNKIVILLKQIKDILYKLDIKERKTS